MSFGAETHVNHWLMETELSVMADQLVLYLDFDGVLHPDEVYLINGRPVIQGKYAHMKLFCWAPILEEILAPYPDVKIKLSTSWVRVKSFAYAKRQLPKSLQQRVVGTTYTRQVGFSMMPRFAQIHSDVHRNGIKQWIAIDDDTFGWPVEFMGNLVQTHDDYGLGHPDAQRDLKEKLLGILSTPGGD